MRDSNTQPAGADNGVAGFSMKKTLIIAGCVCLLLLAGGIAVAIVLLARGGGSAESPELRAASATALPIAPALPAATDRPVAPDESPEQVAPATAVPTVTALPAATDRPVAPTVELALPAAMSWAEVVRLHELNQDNDPTGLYTDALMRLKSGDITGQDVVETVEGSSSFTTFCAMANAWNDSNWPNYGTQSYKTVSRELNQRLADGWPSRDFGDCSDDLDWSSLTN